jgi:redox-sensitive bicupin YhaK (pirin superfamily)
MSWQKARDAGCSKEEACDPVELVIEPREHDLGGFTVRRALPVRQRRMVGPFIFFDHMGPATLGPDNPINVRPHPHIGLSTLTWLFEGEIMHRDSLGFTQKIKAGEVNWMTAGSGIVHSERTPEDLLGQSNDLHGLQIWMALPRAYEEVEPRFQHYHRNQLPVLNRDGILAVLVAGTPI